MMTAIYEHTDKNGFETTPCGRCAGSGQYSFNLMHGTMCYGCKGTGFKYTRRGKAARDFYMSLRQRKVTDLKPGDVVYTNGFSNGWRTVVSVTVKENNRVFILFKNGNGYGTDATETLTVDGLADEARKQALEYQDTLAKTGKVSKRVKAK